MSVIQPVGKEGTVHDENAGAILGAQLRPRPPDTYAALLRELSAIGNNVNQLAHQANARDEASKEEISEAARLVRQAVRLVKDTL